MSRHRLGELQLAIARILWERGEATVADVHQALEPERGLAFSTIATMLRKMEAKGVVAHRKDGRQFVYRPAVEPEDVTRTMVSELVDRVFGGDATALVSHLLTESDGEPGDLERLTREVEQRRRKEEEGR